MILVTGCFTVTSQAAEIPLPSAAVAVITAVPLPTAVTVPSVETVATAALLLDQVTDLSSASEGSTVVVRATKSPGFMDRLELLRLIDVTFLITLQTAYSVQSCVGVKLVLSGRISPFLVRLQPTNPRVLS